MIDEVYNTCNKKANAVGNGLRQKTADVIDEYFQYETDITIKSGWILFFRESYKSSGLYRERRKWKLHGSITDG